MTSAPIAVIDGVPIDLPQALGAALAALALLLVLTLVALMRASAARRRERDIADERQEAIEARFAALAQSSAELSGRLSGMADWLGAGIEKQAQRTGENLGKLNERLAVIDAAQARLTEMTREVVSLKDILANKQARGAFGQGRMEAIVRDGLPAGAYDFQFTLSNRARPDCVIRLPGDARLLAVDAKFPLEAFSALRAARDDEARKAAQARVRADVGKHVKDIAERYLDPGRDAGRGADVRALRGDLFRSRRAFRRRRAEGASRPGRHRLADADDDGDRGRPGDPARRADARRSAGRSRPRSASWSTTSAC